MLADATALHCVQGNDPTPAPSLTTGILPQLDTGLVTYGVLAGATALKLIAYVICVHLQNKSDSMLALAEDHLNDVISNICAIGTAAVASEVSVRVCMCVCEVVMRACLHVFYFVCVSCLCVLACVCCGGVCVFVRLSGLSSVIVIK